MVGVGEGGGEGKATNPPPLGEVDRRKAASRRGRAALDLPPFGRQTIGAAVMKRVV